MARCTRLAPCVGLILDGSKVLPGRSPAGADQADHRRQLHQGMVSRFRRVVLGLSAVRPRLRASALQIRTSWLGVGSYTSRAVALDFGVVSWAGGWSGRLSCSTSRPMMGGSSPPLASSYRSITSPGTAAPASGQVNAADHRHHGGHLCRSPADALAGASDGPPWRGRVRVDAGSMMPWPGPSRADHLEADHRGGHPGPAMRATSCTRMAGAGLGSITA